MKNTDVFHLVTTIEAAAAAVLCCNEMRGYFHVFLGTLVATVYLVNAIVYLCIVSGDETPACHHGLGRNCCHCSILDSLFSGHQTPQKASSVWFKTKCIPRLYM